jgi:hypothetical protein
LHDANHWLLENRQVVVLLIGSIVPLGGYVLNRLAPWASETVKGLIQVALAAVAAALYTALNTNVIGFNGDTLQLILTGVVGALFAHHLLWKPAKVNLKLGATDPSP